MLNVFKFGFSVGWQQWKIVAMVYFFQLCLAVTLGLEAKGVLDSSIGNSLEINKLLTNYDHTVFTDFLKTHGASITPLIGQLRWLIVIYILFAVFIDAGLLVCASKPNEANTQRFLQGGATYFFSFSKLTLIFLTLAIAWTAIVFVPIAWVLQPALEYFPNEKYAVWGLILGIVLYLLGLSALFLWSVAARFWKINNNVSIVASLKNGWSTFRKNKKQIWRLLGLFFSVQVLLVAVYWTLDAYLGMTSAIFVLLMLLIQQAFSFFRVMIRQMFYISAAKLMQPL